MQIVEGDALKALTEKALCLQLVLRWDEHYRQNQIASKAAAAVIADKITALLLIGEQNPVLATEINDLIAQLEAIQ